MAWLARLDARAARWPRLFRYPYLALKWYLAIFGGIALLRVWLDRVGLWSLY